VKKAYHFRCIDKFGVERSTANILADSEDEAQQRAERWCAEFLKGESGTRVQRVDGGRTDT
jgi:hypothetical protein